MGVKVDLSSLGNDMPVYWRWQQSWGDNIWTWESKV